MSTKLQSKRKLESDRNQIEQAPDLKGEFVNVVKNELLEKSITSAWEQLLGPTRKMTKEDIQKPVNEGPVRGDLNEGEFLTIAKSEAKEQKKPDIAPAIDYVREILTTSEQRQKQENRELRTKIEEITIELKKLSKSSKELEVTIKDVNIDLLPEAPGKYHVNFFEWILLTIQIARVRVEESANWASTVTGKRAKKDYWSLSRKHGTSYQLSGERAVAQQVG